MKFYIPKAGLEEVTMSSGVKVVGIEHKGEFVILNQQLQEFKNRVIEEEKEESK